VKLPSLAEIRKGAVAVAGLAGQIVALNLLHGTAEHVAQVVLAAATALAVFGVPNADKPAPPTGA
jgi:hypothetical protein